jgi:hypothetical protein
MPGVIGAAVAVATFPVNLSTKFVETHTVLANLNEYSDGSSQRKSLVLGGRRSWKLAKRLVPAEMVQLRTFWEDHTADAFNFYNPFETIPPFSRTPTGGSGLYIVRFASDWEQTNGMARSDASCELIEVAGGTDLGGGIVVPPIGPTTIQAATLSILTSFQILNPPVGGGVVATLHVAAGPHRANKRVLYRQHQLRDGRTIECPLLEGHRRASLRAGPTVSTYSSTIPSAASSRPESAQPSRKSTTSIWTLPIRTERSRAAPHLHVDETRDRRIRHHHKSRQCDGRRPVYLCHADALRF